MKPIVIVLTLTGLLAACGGGDSFGMTLAPLAATKKTTPAPDRDPLVSVLRNDTATIKCLRTDISKYAGSRVLAL